MFAIPKGVLDQDTIISRDKYLNAAVLVTFYREHERLYLVFEKRAQHVRQGGEISFPGGEKEGGDVTFEETAVRETMEELRLARERIVVYGKLGALISPGGVLVEAYLGELEVTDVASIDFDREEVADLIQVPFEFFVNTPPETYSLVVETHPYGERDGQRVVFPAKELGLPARYHQPWQGRDRVVYLYRYENEIIWGITADIVHEIVRRLGALGTGQCLSDR